MPVTQFINLVDAPSLDKTSRTTVRVQAMHDYHRRRVSAKGKAVPVRRPPPPIVLSAKAQTQKFRLGREKVLRPWVAVKSKLGRRQAAELSLQNKVHDQRQEADQEVKVQYTLDVQDESKLLGSFQGLSAEDVVVARLPSRTESEVEQSSPVYDFFLPVATLYDSPSSGRVDPFAAMSLLITPRTQMLMHHYCEFLSSSRKCRFSLSAATNTFPSTSQGPPPIRLANDAHAKDPLLPRHPRPSHVPLLPNALRHRLQRPLQHRQQHRNHLPRQYGGATDQRAAGRFNESVE